jgi:archaetidylinositol phosphate synthase
MLKSKYRNSAEPFIDFIAKPLARAGLSPNFITFLGVGFSIVAGYMYATHNLIFAFFALLLAAVSDAVDGAVARLTKKESPFGGVLDSVLDRYSDTAILVGIAFFLADHYLLVFIVLVGSFLVSYTRARAELEIEKCDVGIGERAERLIILIIATVIQAMNIAGVNALYWALVILAVLTHLTVVQRVWFTYNTLKE